MDFTTRKLTWQIQFLLCVKVDIYLGKQQYWKVRCAFNFCGGHKIIFGYKFRGLLITI